jgi:rSAM/selenodomain-associated transferase 2
MRLSIVMPVLDEAVRIAPALDALAPLRARGAEVIVVDGGSKDDTVALARTRADRVTPAAPRGRAAQMNAGARLARGDVLLFLHADTALPEQADRLVCDALASARHVWGRFDVRFEGGALPLVARMMNLRSRLTGVATGDQAVFVTRAAFNTVDGFPDIALMEDVALSKRLKRVSPPLCLAECVTTSPRRWHERGVARTILLMWRLRLAYVLGVDPARLARAYGYVGAEH